MATPPMLPSATLPKARPHPLTAKYGGACRLCGRSVAVDTEVVYWRDEPRGAKLAHVDCYTAAAGGAPMPAAGFTADPAQAVAPIVASVAAAAGLPADQVAEIARTAAREWLADGTDKIQSNVTAALDARANKLRDEILGGMARTVRVDNVTPAGTKSVDVGLQHRLFPELLQDCNARDHAGRRLNIFLAGPAGSGKSTAAEAAAKALGLDYDFNGAIDTEYKLLGFTDAMGRLVSRPFRRIWEHGGIYLFDEVDGSLASALLALNAALANGICDFPDGSVRRHPDCVIIACGNTWGNGATAKFIGRNKLDGASLDRFVRWEWPIDETLESALAAKAGIPASWVKRVQATRARIYAKGLEITCSPRATFNGGALLAAGQSEERVAVKTLYAGLTREQIDAISA